MATDLDGASVLLTGASAGIGAALAPMLSAKGARVGIVGRRQSRLDDVAAGCDGDVTSWAQDLGDVDAAVALAHEAWEHFGGLDVVVHNAGMPMRRLVQDLSADDLTETMRVNFEAPARMTTALLPRMLERDSGMIVNVSSAGGRLGIFQEAAYCASKFALTGWSECLALDLFHTGVEVRLITPGAIATEIWDRPGNAESPYDGDMDTPETAAAAIVDAIEGDDFETYVPDLSNVVRWKTENIDTFLEMAAPQPDA